MLSLLNIIISCRKKLRNNALDIITNVPGFCKGSRICDRKRHIQKFRKCLDQISLTTSGRSDHQHIGFLDCDFIHCIGRNTFIMIINGNGHNLFRILLSDHIFIKCCLDLVWCGNLFQIEDRIFLFTFFLLWFRLLSHLILEAAQIDHTDIRHVKQIAIIKIATLHLCVHAVETSLHAVRTYMYIIRKIDHLSCLTLRTMTEGTELLRFIIIGLIICILIFFLYDLIIVFICHINSFHLQRFATSLICKTHRLMAPVPAHLPMRSL